VKLDYTPILPQFSDNRPILKGGYVTIGDNTMKLHPLSAGLAAGIIVGVYTLGFTLISLYCGGYGRDFLLMWEDLHPGYSISHIGALIGFAYSFVEGFFLGLYRVTSIQLPCQKVRLIQ